MRLRLIEKLPILPHMSFLTKLVRRRAPRYIQSVIEDTKALSRIETIKELRPEHVNPLSGGRASATYLVKSPHHQVVIKLSSQGVMAEAEALAAWGKRGTHVPRTLDKGTVPISKKQKHPVKYLIQKAIADKHGRIAETCADFLIREPGKARKIGALLGKELSKMHSIVARRSFGDFGDAPGNKAAYRSWGAYLKGYIDMHEEYLLSLGLEPRDVGVIRHILKHHNFSPRPRYVHGDFSIRNSLVTDYDPLRIAVIDPNPLIGDRSWDVAVLFNNYEYQKWRRKFVPNSSEAVYRLHQQIWFGFKTTYRYETDPVALRIAQLMHAIFQIGHENGKKKWQHDKKGLKAYENMIRDIVHKIVKEGA